MRPNSVDSTIRKSKSLCKIRDYLGAVSVLERTLERFPNNKRIVNETISIQKKFASSQLELPSVALLTEVLTLVKSNDLKNSLSKTNELVQTFPNSLDLYNIRGLIFLKSGMFSDAIENFKTVVRIKNNDFQAHNNLGLAYKSTGKIDEACKHFELAIKINNKFYKAMNNLAICYKDQHKSSLAAKTYYEALVIYPKYFLAAKNLAKVYTGYLDQNSLSLLKKVITNAADETKDTSSFKFLEANYERHIGNPEMAFNKYREANKLKFSQVQNHFYKGRLFHQEFKNELSSWMPERNDTNLGSLKKVFILGPSRSGKSSLEKLLLRNPKVYSLYEAAQTITDSQNMGKRLDVERVIGFDDLFFASQEKLKNQGYEIVVSTNPKLIQVIPNILKGTKGCFFIFVNRELYSNASEVFITEYSNGHYYSYNASDTIQEINAYNVLAAFFQEKLPEISITLS
ncbi:MAG: tetratricopeptide repeat protein, partial [Rhodobacteraceae bacterium]|nr:tetratricopeptide repeat protein [Paracoccaceae bacterium]